MSDPAFGVDVSVFQGDIDWAQIVAQNVKFTFIRASYGTFQDGRFQNNWWNAKAAGLLRGAYLFYRPAFDQGPVAQANALVDALGGDLGELPTVVDVERDVTRQGNIWAPVDPPPYEVLEPQLHECLQRITQLTGRRPIIYTGAGYWNAHLSKAEWAQDYELWVANWVKVWTPQTRPVLPPAWGDYRFWQYSSNGNGQGPAFGVATNDLDLDLFNGDLDALRAYADAIAHNGGAPADKPIHSIAVDKTQINAGDSITISMHFEHVGGAWLVRPTDAQPLSGPDATVLDAPQVDTTYILRVKIPATGAMVDTPVTVKVTSQQPVAHVPAGLGVHVLTNVGAWGDAFSKGCRVGVFMNTPTEAAQFAKTDPTRWAPGTNDCFIMYRVYHETRTWASDQMIDQLGGLLGLNTPNKFNVVITLANEWDIGIAGAENSPEGMSKFCDWTLQCLDKLNTRGFHNVAIMTSSVGTPDFTNPGVCNVIRTKLAPEWNSGRIRFCDMHLYSPTKAHIFRSDGDQVWFERRWEFLYTRCGFDPSAPGRIISSETGLDEHGGGYPAHQMSRADVLAHTRQILAVQSAPLVVNGVSCPSPFLAGAVFQCGDASKGSGHWGDYYVAPYLPLVWNL